MAHVPGSANEIRARVPAVLESYAFIRDNVLLDGPADPALKQLCFRFLAGEIEPSGYEGRERAALDWAHAIAWDSDSPTTPSGSDCTPSSARRSSSTSAARSASRWASSTSSARSA